MFGRCLVDIWVTFLLQGILMRERGYFGEKNHVLVLEWVLVQTKMTPTLISISLEMGVSLVQIASGLHTNPTPISTSLEMGVSSG